MHGQQPREDASRPCVRRRDIGGVALGLLIVLALILSSGAGALVRAQPAERVAPGYPPLQNYTPEDYGRRYQSQNWSVTQDARGVIYVANPNGVLVYDAETWRLIPTDGRSLVRTVIADTAGTIFVGAYGEIGALRPDSAGTLQYASLLDELPPEQRGFGHTWSGVATPDGVYFQTRAHLFRWDGTQMRHWEAPAGDAQFQKIFAVRDTVYVSIWDAGLHRLVDGALEPVPGGDAFDDGVYALLPYGDGLLLGTETGKLYRSQGDAFEAFRTPADAFLQANELYDGVQLPGGMYAFATLRGGVLLMDRDGQTVHVLDERSQIISNDVKSLFVDRQGGLWMACETGITRAEVLSPLAYYDERAGLEGVAMSLARHEGRMHVGTSAGLFALTTETAPDGTTRPTYQRVGDFRAQVFDILSSGSGLLAATTKGVYHIRDGATQRIGRSRTAFRLHASQGDDGLVYVGYIDGLGSLRQSGTDWAAGESLDDFEQEIHFMGEDTEDGLWAASSYGGLWRIQAPDGFRGAPPVEQIAEEGQSPRHTYRMTQLPDGLRIVTRSGLARPTVGETGQVSMEPDSSLRSSLPAETNIVDLKAAPDGERWVFTDAGVLRLQPRPGERGYTVSEPLARAEDLSVFVTRAEAGGLFWVAGEEGVLRHTPRATDPPQTHITTLIRRIATVGEDSLIFGGNGATVAAAPTLSAKQNALRFEFAATGFGNEAAIEYQYRLRGFDDEWSAWTDESQKDYTNLPAGRYTLEVRGRNAGLWQARPASFALSIRPPWYQTGWAYALYALLGIAIVAGAVRWRSAQLEARARELEARIAERTVEVKEQAERLEAYNNELQQTNVALQEALEQKSELLGIAAHDLKNPLFGIRGLTEILLERDTLDEGMRRKLDLIHDSADETLTLINDLLESVAASSGQVQLDMERLNMVAAGEWVVHRFEAQAEDKGQTLTFSAKHPDCPVRADQRRLREAMNNLVSNAIKYSPYDSTICVEVDRDGDQAAFTVRDEGPGLSEDEQQNVFQPFQRLSPEPTGGEASSGLGLYIVQQLVELHDGAVRVESEEGVGSAFTLAIPLAAEPESQKSSMASVQH